MRTPNPAPPSRDNPSTLPQSATAPVPASESSWTSLFARILLPATLFGISVLGLAPAKAQVADARAVPTALVAPDLQAGVAAARTPQVNWARDIRGSRYVQLIVVSRGSDPELADLRNFVLRQGGSVLARHAALRALTVQVKSTTVELLARRPDVATISPNRATGSTASTLESVTGAVADAVRTGSSRSGYTGLDGHGIGIAVLDSGVMRTHRAFEDASGASRVRRNVNVLNASIASWSQGLDNGTSPMPGSTSLAVYENQIATDYANFQDPYGHGTHVAAVAAGSASRYSDLTPDLSGIAPGADIYDVRVLSDQGYGTVSDAIAGIEWVIFHAREYNIRVINMSLAASSTETWQSDPLCAAVRSAAAAGITVVVAAGNFGQSSQGSEVYGTVGAPANDPTVITVGSAHMMGTVTRVDDTVNRFSSRGPTRGYWVTAGGVRVVDNLLKPDLVAPGNRIIAAAATNSDGRAMQWNQLAQTYRASLVDPLGLPQAYGETQMMFSRPAPCCRRL